MNEQELIMDIANNLIWLDVLCLMSGLLMGWYIIPVVFKAEDALQKAKPEWKERLCRLGQSDSNEDPHKVAAEYCREIATIIVMQGSDYEPDGTIDESKPLR